jgi:hypothetical protein
MLLCKCLIKQCNQSAYNMLRRQGHEITQVCVCECGPTRSQINDSTKQKQTKLLLLIALVSLIRLGRRVLLVLRSTCLLCLGVEGANVVE